MYTYSYRFTQTHARTDSLLSLSTYILPLLQLLVIFSWLGRIPVGTDLLQYPQNGGRKSSSPEMRAEQHLGGPCSWYTVSGLHQGQHRDTPRLEQQPQTQSCISRGLQHQAWDRGRRPRWPQTVKLIGQSSAVRYWVYLGSGQGQLLESLDWVYLDWNQRQGGSWFPSSIRATVRFER